MALSAAALEETVERLDQRVSKILTMLTIAMPRPLEGQIYVAQSMIEASVDRELKGIDLRHKIFPKIACDQISWALLLVAYKHTTKQMPLPVTVLTSYTNAPATTSLTHMTTLERAGLLQSEADVTDGRRRYITATSETCRLMVRYFTALHSP